MSSEIIRTIENDVEFFTVKSTGESGMSLTSLALSCGIARQTISELLEKSVAGKRDSESLKPLLGKDFELQVNPSYKNAKIISDWACACIIEYYALDARKTTQSAKQSLRLFCNIGIRAFIQKMTHWQPSQPEIVEPTIAQIEAVFAGLYNFPIDKKLIESAKLTAIAKSLPSLTNSAEEAKQLLSTQMTIEERPMSPTQLGLLIAQNLSLKVAPSARKINQILTEKELQIAEYQTRTSGKKRLQYRLTPLGESYGQMQLEQASNADKTIIIVRWFSRVLDLISEAF